MQTNIKQSRGGDIQNRITNIKVTSILAWCNKVVDFLAMSVVVVPRFWYEQVPGRLWQGRAYVFRLSEPEPWCPMTQWPLCSCQHVLCTNSYADQIHCCRGITFQLINYSSVKHYKFGLLLTFVLIWKGS